MTLDLSRYYQDEAFAAYDFGPGHPFAPVRQSLTVDLLRRGGLLPPSAVCSAPPLDDDTLLLFHSEAYVAAVKAAGKPHRPGTYIQYGLGTGDNPIFPDMHEAATVRVGATLDAVRRVARGEIVHAANFSGGLHHAHRAKASGFCIYNDAAVAIAWLRKTLDCKVAYIDLDAHHGDGVQWGFYDDPDVLTISIHETGRTLFPGTGSVDEIGEGAAKGTKVNIPLEPSTDGENWLECFHLVVPDVIDAFRPDFLITQHGCDAHRLDPLSHLAISVESLWEAAVAIHQLAHEYTGGRWVALGGGGYAAWQVVPRAWALTWAAMTDQAPRGALPDEWIAHWSPRSPLPLPTHWYDLADQAPIKDWADFDRELRAEENLATARRARREALRYLKERGGRSR